MPFIYVKAPNCYYTYELPTTPGAEVLIGTAQHCHLSLPMVQGLEPVHAGITNRGAEYMIEDKGTYGGVYAGGTRVFVPVFLMPGVEYRMGALTLVLAPEGAQRPSPRQTSNTYYIIQQTPAPQPQSQAEEVDDGLPKSKASLLRKGVEKMSLDEYTQLRMGTLSVKKKSSLIVRCIVVGVSLLFVAFILGWLPLKPSDVKVFLNTLERDMGSRKSTTAPAKAPTAAKATQSEKKQTAAKTAQTVEAPPRETTPTPPEPQKKEAVYDGFEAVDDDEGAVKASSRAPITMLPEADDDEKPVKEPEPRPAAELWQELNFLSGKPNTDAQHVVYYQMRGDCPACNVVTEKLVKEYPNMSRKGVEVVVVSMDANEEETRKTIERAKIKCPVLQGDPETLRKLPAAPSFMKSVPRAVFTDAEGKVLAQEHGAAIWDWENVLFPRCTGKNLHKQLAALDVKEMKLNPKASSFIYHWAVSAPEQECNATLQELEAEYRDMRAAGVELILFVPSYNEEFLSALKRHRKKFPVVIYDWREGVSALPGFAFLRNSIVDHEGRLLATSPDEELPDWRKALNKK